MTTPLWKYPGVLEGRILPENSIPQGALSQSQYGYYSYYYGYYGEAVYCLGEDVSHFQDYRLYNGQYAHVQQTFTISAAHKLLLFSWHMRQPDMPVSRNIVVAGPVDFVGQRLVAPGGALDGTAPAGTGLLTSGDSCTGVRIPDTSHSSVQSLFTKADRELYLLVSGATDAANNGYHRISTIPWGQAGVSGGDRALTEFPDQTTIVQRAADPSVTLRVLGVTWKGRLWYKTAAGAWTEYFALEEEYSHTWYRTGLALNVSKYTGSLSIKFELKVERLT